MEKMQKWYKQQWWKEYKTLKGTHILHCFRPINGNSIDLVLPSFFLVLSSKIGQMFAVLKFTVCFKFKTNDLLVLTLI